MGSSERNVYGWVCICVATPFRVIQFNIYRYLHMSILCCIIINSLLFPSPLPFWKGFGIRDYALMLWRPIFTWLILSSFSTNEISFPSYLPLLPSFHKCKSHTKSMRLATSSVINSLRVPCPRYTLPFPLPLLTIGFMGSRPIISPLGSPWPIMITQKLTG